MTTINRQGQQPDGADEARLRMPVWLSFVSVLIGIYLLFLSCASVGALSWLSFTGSSELGLQSANLREARAGLLTGAGAALGGSLLGFVGLFRHAVLNADFNPRYIGSYLIGPLALVFLGIVAFVLVRAGLWAFGGAETIPSEELPNRLAFAALGILVGFSWRRLVGRLADISAHVLSSEPNKQDS